MLRNPDLELISLSSPKNENSTTPLNKESYQPIEISDNYKIEVPSKFIDPIGNDIMAIPVLGTDGHAYEATMLGSWLATGQNKKSPLISNVILVKEMTFDLYIYNDIRAFFSSLIEKDKALLNDGHHKEALTIIKKRAEGVTQEDNAVSDLKEFCKKNNIALHALQTLPSKPIQYSSSQVQTNTADETVIDITKEPLKNPSNETSIVPEAVSVSIRVTPSVIRTPVLSTSDYSRILARIEFASVTYGSLPSAFIAVLNEYGHVFDPTSYFIPILRLAIGTFGCGIAMLDAKKTRVPPVELNDDILSLIVTSSSARKGIGLFFSSVPLLTGFFVPAWQPPLAFYALIGTMKICIDMQEPVGRCLGSMRSALSNFSLWSRSSSSPHEEDNEEQMLVSNRRENRRGQFSNH